MTQLLIANIGNYPRIGEQKDQQRHRRGLAHFQNQDISAHAFRDVQQSVIQEIIREQLDCGLDEVTDGLVSWYDPISHLCSKVQGIRAGGLLRYFDLNFYYRVPVFTAKPRRKESLLAPEFSFAKATSPKTVRAVLTGPFTLAQHSRGEIRPFDKFSSRLQFFSELIAQEIKDLVAAGATHIQVDEPALGLPDADLALFRKSFNVWRSQAPSAYTILAVYHTPIAGIYPQLLDLPVDGLQLDFTVDGKKLTEAVMKSRPKQSIGWGVLSVRTTRLEPIDPILNTLRQWIETAGPSTVYVSPAAGLETLPRENAIAKLKLLQKIKQESLAKIASPNA